MERVAQISWRDRYLAFVAHHDIAWELGMAVLAVVYVVVGFAAEDTDPAVRPALDAAETALTTVFVGEFVSRFMASYDRARYVSTSTRSLHTRRFGLVA